MRGGRVDEGREFRFVAEKVYSIPGRGVVVTGRVERGTVSVGDEIGFLGADGRYVGAMVMAIEAARRLVEMAESGQEASLLLQGVKKGQIATGAVLTAAPQAPPAPVAPSPSETFSFETPSLPPSPYSSGPIQPSSTFWRTALFILIGILILLLLLFYQGIWDPTKWDPRKKLTSIGMSGGQRVGTAWDVAYAALFPAPEEADFITGAALPADGGQSVNVRETRKIS
jgi:hypothetical protein